VRRNAVWLGRKCARNGSFQVKQIEGCIRMSYAFIALKFKEAGIKHATLFFSFFFFFFFFFFFLGLLVK
jgi:hypothetical protein